MTTPQSGREAFEALNAAAKGAGHLSFESMRQCADAWIGVTKVLDDVADGWTHGLGTGDEQAAAAIRALAQQGREVGEPVAWPTVIAELHEHMRHCVSAADEGVDYAVSREMLDAMTTLRLMEKCGRGKWRPTEYGESFANTAAPKQQAVEVTEEMVEAFAHKVFDDANDIYGCGETDAYRDALVMAVRENIALLAALPGKTEVDRG